MREPSVKVFELNPLEDPRWNVLTKLHPDATVFHTVEWLQALKACYGYAPRVLTLTPPGPPLRSGLVFCEVRSFLTGNRLVALPFSDHCEPLLDRLEEFDPLLNYFAEIADEKRWKYCEIRPLTWKPDPERDFGATNTYFIHRLDLEASETSLFKSFHKNSVQRKIRRAEREQLRCQEGSSEKLLDCFYNLLILTRRRQGLPPQPRKWFQSLIAHMGPNLKIRVVLKGETPVASILTLSHKKTIVYKYGCSDARFNNLGGTALLFWRTIQEAKTSGLNSFDLGRSDLDNPGLVTFKNHWGATRTTVNYWRHPAQAAASKPEGAIKHFKRIISIAPKKSLAILGNLLYRHIG